MTALKSSPRSASEFPSETTTDTTPAKPAAPAVVTLSGAGRIICAWCQRVLGIKMDMVHDTHTVCPACKEKLLADLARDAAAEKAAAQEETVCPACELARMMAGEPWRQWHDRRIVPCANHKPC